MSNVLNQHGVPNVGIKMNIKNNSTSIESLGGRVTILEGLPPIIVSETAPTENLKEGLLWRQKSTGINKICIQHPTTKVFSFEPFEYTEDLREELEGTRNYFNTYIEEEVAEVTNLINSGVGDKTVLKTGFKDTLVGAVNEIVDNVKELQLTGGGNADYDITAEVKRGESTFNSVAGVLVTHNLNTTDYGISVESLTTGSGAIGEIWIGDKTANSFKVYNSGSDIASGFVWAAISRVPRVIRGTNTLNSTTGRVVAHGANTLNYSVSITPTANPGGELGDLYITNKTLNSFTVMCTGANNTATFDWILYR